MRQRSDETGKGNKVLQPISFGEHPGPEPYNASEIVAIADSRFLFCDNNVGDGLFELQLTAEARWPVHSSGVRSAALKRKRWTIWSA